MTVYCCGCVLRCNCCTCVYEIGGIMPFGVAIHSLPYAHTSVAAALERLPHGVGLTGRTFYQLRSFYNSGSLCSRPQLYEILLSSYVTVYSTSVHTYNIHLLEHHAAAPSLHEVPDVRVHPQQLCCCQRCMCCLLCGSSICCLIPHYGSA